MSMTGAGGDDSLEIVAVLTKYTDLRAQGFV